ncbi:MAG TPA: peptide MFS transporter [Polyangiaceae bacterium]|nr:peptide MFS transporter [Polyangiaceae bacterium]
MLELIVSFVLLGYAIFATFFTVESGKHPRALYFLFGAEMWERFSYYGMRALLVLYLVEQHGWQPEQSSTVYKWYTSLVYLTPLLGGFLADQFLGLRASIVVGGALMALGHFLMAFEPLPIFYVALGCLIAGNGFFKPNMSTLVGKMYGKEDPRRDGAFTIFYMGINVGAGVAPIWCAEVREHFHSFHWGFALAGIGMVFGLVMFLIGQGTVLRAVAAAGNDLRTQWQIKHAKEPPPEPAEQQEGAPYREQAAKKGGEATDEEKPRASGIAGLLGAIYPYVLLTSSFGLPVYYGLRVYRHLEPATALIMPCAFAAVFLTMGLLLRTIRGAAKDKSVVIFVLFIFVVLFWMAFEQAGNALNLWAEFFTDRHIGSSAYSAESFQSVNPICILLFAPLFSLGWVWLAKRGLEPRTPTKMLLAMLLMAASFGVMVVGAARENAVKSRVEAKMPVPDGIMLGKPVKGDPARTTLVACGPKQGKCTPENAEIVFDAERLTAVQSNEEIVALEVRGVLAHYVVQQLLEVVAPPGWVDWVGSLDDKTKNATEAQPVAFDLASIDVPGAPLTFAFPLDAKAAKEAGVAWNPAADTLTFTKHADAGVRTVLAAAAAPKELHDAVTKLEEQSKGARNTGLWLLLSYVLATLGELCLSPVGLSMVTKLAPRRFASLFMGVWLLSSSVAQYAGGSIGESWGRIAPIPYFWLFVWTSLAGAVVLLLLVRPLQRLMHEVH